MDMQSMLTSGECADLDRHGHDPVSAFNEGCRSYIIAIDIPQHHRNLTYPDDRTRFGCSVLRHNTSRAAKTSEHSTDRDDGQCTCFPALHTDSPLEHYSPAPTIPHARSNM